MSKKILAYVLLMNIFVLHSSEITAGFGFWRSFGHLLNGGVPDNGLHHAAEAGDIEEIKNYLNAGVNVDYQNIYGLTALMIASGRGKGHAVNFLLGRSAAVNLHDEEGDTALSMAVAGDYPEVVRVLLNGNAPYVECGGMPLLTFAIANKSENVACYLIKANQVDVNLTGRFSPPIFLAVEQGLYEVVKLLIEREASVVLQISNGRIPLHNAVLINNEKIARLLLAPEDNGIDLQDNNGSTPLHYAVSKEFEGMTVLLLDRGATVDIQSNDGFSPLHHGVWRNNKKIVRHLLAQEGNGIDLQDNSGTTPLHYAVLKGYEDMAVLLLHSGASVDTQDDNGCTALHYAVLKGYEEMVIFLLGLRVAVDIKDNDGLTALHLAVMKGFERIAFLLLNSRASVAIKDTKGRLALHYAVILKKQDVVAGLISRLERSVIDVRDINGLTALMYSVMVFGRLAGSEGASIDQGDVINRPVLARTGDSLRCFEIIRLLLQHGADIHLTNHENKSALSRALVINDESLVNLLLDYSDRNVSRQPAEHAQAGQQDSEFRSHVEQERRYNFRPRPARESNENRSMPGPVRRVKQERQERLRPEYAR